MTEAYLNTVATAVPRHDVHALFLDFARSLLAHDNRKSALLARMASRAGIEHRYSVLAAAPAADGGALAAADFYPRGHFPGTAARMQLFAQEAPLLAEAAITALGTEATGRITHIVTACCTGFAAPGIDQRIIERCGLAPDIERTMVGFMGCHAAINALKVARHIVRSEPESRVLVLNLELCSLHLKETVDLEQILSFMLFADGCTAALVSANPVGFCIDSFRAVTLPRSERLITWDIGDQGFDMVLSGQVPGAILSALQASSGEILRDTPPSEFALWAIHPGGRTILDAVENALQVDGDALAHSRDVLRRFGNMSSSTVMFVLRQMLASLPASGARGCAMSFGPGLTAETMLFHAA